MLFVGPDLTDHLRAFVKSTLNIEEKDLLVVASHTHFAPPVDATKPALGLLDQSYLDWVERQCCELLSNIAARPMQPVNFRLGMLQWNGVVYRRLRWLFPHIWGRRISLGVVIAPNHRKRINRDLRILELVDNFGKSIALIWSGSCHPLGWPNELELSSDYIGVVRERLQDSIGRHTPVLFLQGFAGDLRPDVPENRKLTRRFWRTIFFGPSFASFDEMNWQTWVENLVALIATGLDGIRRGEAAPLTGHLASARVRIPLSLVLDGPDGGQRYVHFQRLRLGKMCEILSISAEPCSRLLSFLDDPTIWPIGYNGDVFGYWPTDQQRREGGYEAND